MKELFLIASLFLVVSITAGETTARKTPWDSLKITWGRPITDPKFFIDQPRTEEDAIKAGFVKKDDCDSTGIWRGKRYVKEEDYTLILLYDTNGFIAGMQTTVPHDLKPGYPPANQQPPFVYHEKGWVLTVYFTDPSTICTTGRSAEDFTRDGTASDLYYQNGTTPADVYKVPNLITDIQKTDFKGGQCYYTMGKHYWYDLRADLDCNTLFPFYFLYNGGELTGFGWAILANMSYTHYEHPPSSTLWISMNPIPVCLYEIVFSTLHVYFTKDISALKC